MSVEFRIWRPVEPDLELFRQLLPPSVTEVVFFAALDADEQSGYQWILERLATEIDLPNLTSFAIQTQLGSLTDTGTSISHILRSYQGIEKLEVGMGHSYQILEVIRTAAELPHLLHLKIKDPNGYSATREPESSLRHSGSFPALESLELSSPPDCLASFLDQVSSRSVRSIRFEMTSNARPHQFEAATIKSIADCFRTIGEFVRLKALDVELQVQTTWNTLQYILRCKDLETLGIVTAWGYSLELQAGHLEQMGRALRNLTTLRLEPFDSSDSPRTSPTFTDLKVIATEFRMLRKLTITCDARSAPNDGFRGIDRAVTAQNSLQELNVTMSPIDKEAEEIVGMLLRLWWPNLTKVKWLTSAYSSSWSVVHANQR
ncbi:hypothetical protein FRC01_007027, partial [Tulasnella sp. 417]